MAAAGAVGGQEEFSANNPAKNGRSTAINTRLAVRALGRNSGKERSSGPNREESEKSERASVQSTAQNATAEAERGRRR